MKKGEHMITLTIPNNRDIIIKKIKIDLEYLPNQSRKEETCMATATISLDEIQKLYNECGINKEAQQTDKFTEPETTFYYSLPTLYSDVPLVYCDKIEKSI